MILHTTDIDQDGVMKRAQGVNVGLGNIEPPSAFGTLLTACLLMLKPSPTDEEVYGFVQAASEWMVMFIQGGKEKEQ